MLQLSALLPIEHHQPLQPELTQALNRQRDHLPLQQAVTYGSYVYDDTPISLTLLQQQLSDNQLRIKLGIFFESIIAGCNCADDPTPVETLNEYAEVELSINLKNGDTDCRLIGDD